MEGKVEKERYINIIIEKLFALSLKLFKFIGIYFQPAASEKCRKLQRFQFWIFFINAVLIASLVALQAILKINDVEIILNTLPLITNSPIIIFKFYKIFKHRYELSQLVSDVGEILDQKHMANVKVHLKIFAIFQKANGFFYIFNISILTLSVIPLIVTYGTTKLPFEIWIPFEYESVLIFIPLILWILFSSFLMMLIAFVVDFLLVAIVTLIAIGLDEVGESFRNLNNVPESERSEIIRNLIIKHNEIIEACGKLRKIFSPILFYNFVQSSFVICFSGFLFAQGNFIFMPFFINITNQIFLVCFFGQKLIDSSLQVTDGAFYSGWESFANFNDRSYIRFIILRSQKQIDLRGYYFVIINMTTFKSVNLN